MDELSSALKIQILRVAGVDHGDVGHVGGFQHLVNLAASNPI